MKPYRIEAALNLRGDRLLPEVVSAELGLAPTYSWRKGDPRRGGPRYPPPLRLSASAGDRPSSASPPSRRPLTPKPTDR
jgi:hypothetical protein